MVPGPGAIQRKSTHRNQHQAARSRPHNQPLTGPSESLRSRRPIRTRTCVKSEKIRSPKIIHTAQHRHCKPKGSRCPNRTQVRQLRVKQTADEPKKHRPERRLHTVTASAAQPTCVKHRGENGPCVKAHQAQRALLPTAPSTVEEKELEPTS